MKKFIYLILFSLLTSCATGTYTNRSGDNSNLVSEKKSSLPNDNLNQENSDLDDEIPF